jgi:hypothetical protein
MDFWDILSYAAWIISLRGMDYFRRVASVDADGRHQDQS